MSLEEFYYFLNLLFHYHMPNRLIDERGVYYSKDNFVSDTFGE